MSVVADARTTVEEKLVGAASEMLAEVGPRAMSVRAVAQRAGVNHGLVHHYFGSKDALLRAAMHDLVHRHARFSSEKSHGHVIPAPFALLQDQQYLRAVVRCVLDGEMDLASTELTEDVSTPKAVLDHLTSRHGLDAPDARLKAMIGIGMAIEMGWAALEPFINAVTGTDENDVEAVRAEAVRLREELLAKWWKR
jgi:AcrR family transcriptional regulator